MTEDIETIRAFVALSLSDEVRAELIARSLALQEQYAELNIKWVPFVNYHATLVFIGNIPITDIDKMEAIIKEAVRGVTPFDISIGDTTLFPPDQENKGVLIAAVTSDEALMNVQDRIKHTYLNAGYDIFERPYRPHVTLARLKKNKLAEDELGNSRAAFTVPVTQVHLYKSYKMGGKVYNEIVRSVDL
jgi:RNA 2',3'-cyclic 3'-phosphodiesterase